MTSPGYQKLAVAVIQQAVIDSRVHFCHTNRQKIDKADAIFFLRAPEAKEDRSFWGGMVGVTEDRFKRIPITKEELGISGQKSWFRRL